MVLRGAVGNTVLAGAGCTRGEHLQAFLIEKLVRCPSIALQVSSASANVLKGEPPILMAHIMETASVPGEG